MDLEHDFLEGDGNDGMAQITLHLTEEDKFFPLKYLNDVMSSFDLSFESRNRPSSIDSDYLKNHRRLIMSASETLTYIRYFGLFLGNRVPRGNIV